MAFECMPYGLNVSQDIGYKLEEFYTNTGEGCLGCMEKMGKWIVVAPAHLLTALIVDPALMIYDLVMALFFAAANLVTAFSIKELRDRFCGHSMSFFMTPNSMREHLIQGLFTPCAYHGAKVMNEARHPQVI